MLLVAFHFGSEEFRRCPGCVAACSRMSHVAGPIGKDWANLTQPEQRFSRGSPHRIFPDGVWSQPGEHSNQRCGYGFGPLPHESAAGAPACRKTFDSEAWCIFGWARATRCAAIWLIEAPGREAHGAMEVQLGGQTGRHRRPPTNMAGLGCLERAAGMGFALIALNSVSPVQSAESCPKPLW